MKPINDKPRVNSRKDRTFQTGSKGSKMSKFNYLRSQLKKQSLRSLCSRRRMCKPPSFYQLKTNLEVYSKSHVDLYIEICELILGYNIRY